MRPGETTALPCSAKERALSQGAKIRVVLLTIPHHWYHSQTRQQVPMIFEDELDGI